MVSMQLMAAFSAALALTLSMGEPYVSSTSRQMQFPKFSQASCNNLPTLTCQVVPTEGYATVGDVTFEPVWEPREEGSSLFTCYTRIQATIYNLTASSLHGFHVHTYGDLSVSDGSSTGDHFTQPSGVDIPHGYPDDAVRHWGDFGNLESDADGTAIYDRVDKIIRLGAVLGRGITVHAENDKGPSEQPSGDSGDRIGFCVIGYANPEL